MDSRERIARRCAGLLNDGEVINLGIGIPSLVAKYLPKDIDVWLQVENGAIGTAGVVEKNDPLWDKDLTDASGNHIRLKTGGATMDITDAFVVIRGNHLDVTVLGAFQVDEKGNLCNWAVPGQIIVGMGGAMDLAIGAKKVIVAAEHCINGIPKIKKKCDLPLTGEGIVDYIVTELCMIEVTPDGLVLRELSSETTLEEVLEKTEANLIIPEQIGILEDNCIMS